MNLKNLKYMLFLLVTAFVLSSCSETEEDETQAEFANWQERNDQAFADTLAYARQQIANGSKEWKVILNWSLQNQTPVKDANGNEATVTYDDEDYIVVHVIEEGKGTVCPLYTDSIQMSYRGRLIPSKSYANGYVYDQTFEQSEYSTKTAKATSTTINTGYIDGFTTALLNMHVGDHWQVFIPANLGYGSTAQTSIPAYSMLRFEMAMSAYKRGDGAWIYE